MSVDTIVSKGLSVDMIVPRRWLVDAIAIRGLSVNTINPPPLGLSVCIIMIPKDFVLDTNVLSRLPVDMVVPKVSTVDTEVSSGLSVEKIVLRGFSVCMIIPSSFSIDIMVSSLSSVVTFLSRIRLSKAPNKTSDNTQLNDDFEIKIQ